LRNRSSFLRLILGLLILACSTIVYAQNTIPKPINSIEKVGAILYDAALDNPNYYLCDERNIMEYYQVNPKFKEGHNSVKLYFKAATKGLKFSEKINGLLTLRFVINCRGEIGRVRSFTIDANYQSICLNKAKIAVISDHIKQMPNWTPGNYKEKEYDAYKMISFKIINGVITEIIP